MTEIAVRQPAGALAFPDESEMGHVMKVVRSISKTDFVPRTLRGNEAAILACVLTGRALGLDPMHALRAIHIVDGKPTLSAELMVTLARRAGHSIEGNFNPESVTVTGKRGDNQDTMAVTWTSEMAQRAGLVNKDNWKKYPEAMLWARAVSQLCRMLFADVLFGVSYTPEELGERGDVPLPEEGPVLPEPEDSDLPEALRSDADEDPERNRLAGELLRIAHELGEEAFQKTVDAMTKHKKSHTVDQDKVWLLDQIAKANKKLEGQGQLA